MRPPEEGMSRRTLLMRLGIVFNGLVGVILAVPVVRYLMSPVIHQRKGKYDSWISLGVIDQFPTGETRFATYRNPVVDPWDGATADIACWVRNVDGNKFQVFHVNCAHLGCPVRWFPQSGLFMCPCHGGVYYEDGSRASGPPTRGLFEYEVRAEGGQLFVRVGELPTPGQSSSSNMVTDIHPCA